MSENWRKLKTNLGQKMRLWRQYKRDDTGATAVEFAIVGIPFVFALIGLIEVSLMYAANSLLQDSTSSAARLIRTGQVQQNIDNPEAMFRDELCSIASVFLDCNRIQYEVISLDGGFADVESTPPMFDNDGNLMSQGFSPGGVNDVVLIRTVYFFPLMTPLIGSLLADGPNQTKFMMSTAVFQTEPYEFVAGP
jgi:Flp pilus assembly protein TadG